ncbi:hypothetical protein [Stappia stellulata]|uniref:hypothetical protein n=1 Tax=Stappia stellulata TaxID=71235 RepID=UPI0004036D04|nr:hypothetical protein [Stappia stellulata]
MPRQAHPDEEMDGVGTSTGGGAPEGSEGGVMTRHWRPGGVASHTRIMLKGTLPF